MVQHLNHRFHFMTIIGTVGAFIYFNAKNISFLQVLAVLIVVTYVLLVWFWIGEVIARYSRRVSEIEKQI